MVIYMPLFNVLIIVCFTWIVKEVLRSFILGFEHKKMRAGRLRSRRPGRRGMPPRCRVGNKRGPGRLGLLDATADFFREEQWDWRKIRILYESD